MAAVAELEDRIFALEKLIREYEVIEGELASLKQGKSVYTRQASGMVFYKSDPATTRSLHKQKLDEMVKEHSELKLKLSRLKSGNK